MLERWVYRVAVNTCLDRLRHRAVPAAVALHHLMTGLRRPESPLHVVFRGWNLGMIHEGQPRVSIDTRPADSISMRSIRRSLNRWTRQA